MRRRVVLLPVVLTGLLLAAGLAAGKLQQGDPVGDAGDGGPDLAGVGWHEPAAGDLQLEVAYAGPVASHTFTRLFWARGEQGSDPLEWYLATVGENTTVFAGHGGQSRELAAQVNRTDTGGLTLRFTRVDPSSASCTVVAGEAGTSSLDGFERSDVAPDGVGDEGLETLWPSTGACPVESVGPADQDMENDAPASGLWLVVAAVAVGLLSRRPIH